MNEAVDKGIKDYVDKVGSHLGAMSDSERAEVLGNVESHIRLCLQLLIRKKNQTEATIQDLEAVIAEMDPPEHYAQELKSESPKPSPAPADRSYLPALVLAGVVILAAIAGVYWSMRFPGKEAPAAQPQQVQNNAALAVTNAPVQPADQIKTEVSAEKEPKTETPAVAQTPVETNKDLATLKEAFEIQQQSILAQYGKALDSIIADLKKKGDLDNILVLQAEQQRLAAERTIPAPADAAESFRTATEEPYMTMVAAMDQYVTAMDELIKKEVAADQIEDAKAVKTEKDKMSTLLADMQTKLPAKAVTEATNSSMEDLGIPFDERPQALYAGELLIKGYSDGVLIVKKDGQQIPLVFKNPSPHLPPVGDISWVYGVGGGAMVYGAPLEGEIHLWNEFRLHVFEKSVILQKNDTHGVESAIFHTPFFSKQAPAKTSTAIGHDADAQTESGRKSTSLVWPSVKDLGTPFDEKPQSLYGGEFQIKGFSDGILVTWNDGRQVVLLLSNPSPHVQSWGDILGLYNAQGGKTKFGAPLDGDFTILNGYYLHVFEKSVMLWRGSDRAIQSAIFNSPFNRFDTQAPATGIQPKGRFHLDCPTKDSSLSLADSAGWQVLHVGGWHNVWQGMRREAPFYVRELEKDKDDELIISYEIPGDFGGNVHLGICVWDGNNWAAYCGPCGGRKITFAATTPEQPELVGKTVDTSSLTGQLRVIAKLKGPMTFSWRVDRNAQWKHMGAISTSIKWLYIGVTGKTWSDKTADLKFKIEGMKSEPSKPAPQPKTSADATPGGAANSVESDKDLAVLKDTYEKQRQSALTQYGKALDSIMADLQKKGDLENLIILQAEKKRFDTEMTVPPPTDAADSFRSASAVYYKAMVASLGQYVTALDVFIKKETAAGRIDEAMAVKAEKDEASTLLAEMQTKLSAKAPVERPKTEKTVSSQSISFPKTYVDETRGAAGISEDHNVYKFNVEKVGQRAKLRFWAGGAMGNNTYGRVTFTAPDEEGQLIYNWKPKDFKIAANVVESYKELKPITCDVSKYVKKPGTFEVKFKWTDGPAGLWILRVELEIN